MTEPKTSRLMASTDPDVPSNKKRFVPLGMQTSASYLSDAD